MPKEQKVICINWIMIVSILKKNRQEALLLINKAPKGNERTKNLAYLYNYEGLTDMAQGKFSDALIKLQKGETFSKEVNDIVQIIKFNTNIALVNGKIGNFKIAIKKSLELASLIEKNKKSLFYRTIQFK